MTTNLLTKRVAGATAIAHLAEMFSPTPGAKIPPAGEVAFRSGGATLRQHASTPRLKGVGRDAVVEIARRKLNDGR
jgi:hypothetical protein